MDATIIFQPETATLPPVSLYLLKVMARHFVRTSRRGLLITAHSAMSQPEAESVALSQQRADAVANTLAVDGVDRSRNDCRMAGQGGPSPTVILPIAIIARRLKSGRP